MNLLALTQGPKAGTTGLATVVTMTDAGLEAGAAAFVALMRPMAEVSSKVDGTDAVNRTEKAADLETDETPAAAEKPSAPGLQGLLLHQMAMAGTCNCESTGSMLPTMEGPQNPAPARVPGVGPERLALPGELGDRERMAPPPVLGEEILSTAGGRGEGLGQQFGDQSALPGAPGRRVDVGQTSEIRLAPRGLDGPFTPIGRLDLTLPAGNEDTAISPVTVGHAEVVPAKPAEGDRDGALFNLAVRLADLAPVPKGRSDLPAALIAGVPISSKAPASAPSDVPMESLLNLPVLPAEGAGTPLPALSERPEPVLVPLSKVQTMLMKNGAPNTTGPSDMAPAPASDVADLPVPPELYTEEVVQKSGVAALLPVMAPVAPAMVASSPPPGASPFATPGLPAPVALPDMSALAQVATSLPEGGRTEVILDPPELGRLRFDVSGAGDQLKIVLSAERPDTVDLLRRHLDQFAIELRNLGAQGVQLGFGAWSENAPRDRQTRAAAPGSRRFDAGSVETPAHTVQKSLGTAGQLDIIL